jgi:hypothetical protein
MMIPYRYWQLLRGLRRKDGLRVSGVAIVAVYALTIALACFQSKAVGVANAAGGSVKSYGAANAILPRLYMPHTYLCSDGDNTAGLQDSLNSSGDVRISGDNCDFNGTVFIPSNKQLQCASRDVVLHFRNRDNKTPFLKIDNAHDISISNCTFADDPGMPPMIFADGSPTGFNFDIIGGGYTGRSYNVQITGNVFLHPRGQAAVEVYGSTGTSVQPFDWNITYNDFKWCGYYSADFDNVAASHIDHNYAFDCAIGNEGEQAGQSFPATTLDYNYVTRDKHGNGYQCKDTLGGGCGGGYANMLTCGTAYSVKGVDYSGCFAKGNTVDGAGNPMEIHRGLGLKDNYIDNTCTNGCRYRDE